MADLTNSQIIQYATEMRNLLISHEKANQQVSVLESYIQCLSQKTFRSTLQDSNSQPIQNLTKKSVANGIKRVYQQVSNQKWMKVTELSALVTQQLDLEQLPEPPTVSAGESIEMDEMASITTKSFCELYRSA
ncbi:uncharacterized protein LOC125650505 [Ostrea edulis]|uniref:uncharacterized protein LOC125650505 n=1 Tax=Ostrea edulis TaxID=37623 RepID=UPI0024AEF4AB|nr:uncharacterized protein LOC125650505 [Ostrea edulis]